VPNGTPSSQVYQHESTLRVCTVFFSALTGFALARFFRVDSILPEVSRWPCFAAALLLFLRFLFGSANHLWYELVRPAAEPRAKRCELFWHLSCLIVIGVLAVYICDSDSVSKFLWRNLWFGIAGVVFNGVTDRFTGRKWVGEWAKVSGCHIVAVGLGLFLDGLSKPVARISRSVRVVVSGRLLFVSSLLGSRPPTSSRRTIMELDPSGRGFPFHLEKLKP
jgi:uncharacterized membrane protein